MSKEYDHKQIEQKWQAEWEKSGIFQVADNSDKTKYYALVEFPFPSGDGLHVGHIRSYTALDIIARQRRMAGYNVLYPMGWDAFGLPTENYAIKTGQSPALVTKQNTDNFRRQLKSLGFSFDWSREINTTDPEYYKWTQWIFLQLYKNGLAYKQKTLINWCPSCKIGLANEEVVNDACERCGTKVEQKEKEQWMLAITKYADRLEKDLDKVDYPEAVKAQQKNWIGRSEGAVIKFDDIEVFTTRPETIFGVAFIAIAGKADKFTGKYVTNPANQEKIPVWEAEYVMGDVGTGAIMGVPAHDDRDFAFAQKHDLALREVVIPERIDKRNPPVEGKKKIERQNVQAIVKNPKTGKYLCLYSHKHDWNTFPMGGVSEGEDVIEAARREVAEESGYINLSEGKILGGQVRSEYFAKHKDENRISYVTLVYFELLDEEVVPRSEQEIQENEIRWIEQKDLNPNFMVHAEMDIWLERLFGESSVHTGPGVLINSGEFNGLNSADAREKIIAKFGEKKITYKLRDWIFSRQRYWGEPIPMIWCEDCGWQMVTEQDLPVRLPKVENYQPRDDGESPLASVTNWLQVKCPKCGGEARRETDTMPNWAGSSWYYLRYLDTKNREALAEPEKIKTWLPVDWYNGGMEHTTLHLLYSRFWHKFLFDIGVVETDEPYAKRTSHGLILAHGGEKMSKSKGNVVNPDKIVELYGADTLRLYEMFLGPFEQAVAWNDDSIIGPRRFLERVWKLDKFVQDHAPGMLLDAYIEQVTDYIEKLKFNTAVSAMMILLKIFEDARAISRGDYETFLKLLAPFAPHITEELWQRLGHTDSIHTQAWPDYRTGITPQGPRVIVIQVNGVVRDSVEVAAGLDQAEIEVLALAREKVQKWLDKKPVKKVVYVPGRLLNFVV